MTLTACYVVANEADAIAESLRSVKAYVDRFVIVDSIFTANPIDATHSTDETKAVCESICAPVPLTYIESDRKLPQEEARNLYLDAVPHGEWIVNLDGDEVLYGDYFEMREVMAWITSDAHGLPAINVPILSAAVLANGYAHEMTAETYRTNPIVHTRGYGPRFFRNSPFLRYREYVTDDGIVDNQGLYQGLHLLGSKAITDARMVIVNHHVRQTFEGYRHDAVWEAANVVMGPGSSMRDRVNGLAV